MEEFTGKGQMAVAHIPGPCKKHLPPFDGVSFAVNDRGTTTSKKVFQLIGLDRPVLGHGKIGEAFLAFKKTCAEDGGQFLIHSITCESRGFLKIWIES